MIGTAIGGALARLRAEAESLMVDSCQLQRRTGGSLDPDTGFVADEWETYWTGKCRVRSGGREAAESQIGGEPVLNLGPVLQVPVDAPVPLRGHRAVVTSVDPGLSSVPLYIESVPTGTRLVMRRIRTSLARPADR